MGALPYIGTVCALRGRERKENAMICENISIGANGHLLFAGQDTVELAKEYGTPLYLLDED